MKFFAIFASIIYHIVMKKQTLAIHTAFQSPDAYSALSMPVYHTAAYEFDDAEVMADAFCGRIRRSRLFARDKPHGNLF